MIQRNVESHLRDLEIAKESGDKAREGCVYCNLGNAYQSLRDFKQAIDYHKQDLSIAKELGQRNTERRAYCNLGNAYDSLGDFKRAIDYHNQSLSIAKELGRRDAEGRAYCNLGNAYLSLGDFKRAIDYHKQDLSIAKELGRRDAEGDAYCNLGNAYQELGDFKQAIDYHDQSLSIAKELGRRDAQGDAYGNLGNAYQSLGDFKRAIDYHDQSLSISKDLGQRDAEGDAYCNLGTAHDSPGDFKQAIDYYKQGLRFAKELGQRDAEGRAYCNLGKSYQSLGDFKQAIDYHDRSLSIAKDLGQRDAEGDAYCNLGKSYQSLGDFERAVDYHEQGLRIAKELGQRDAEGRAYCNLGNSYQSLGDFKQAIYYHNQDLSITRELGQENEEGRACYCVGRDFELSGDLHEALNYYRSSVNVYNRVRGRLQSEDTWKISFRNACQHSYTALWSILLRLEMPEEALRVAEQGRAQALMDLMKYQHGSESLVPESLESKATTIDISSEIPTPTVFIALKGNTVNLWLLMGTDVHFEKKSIKDVSLLMENAFKEIGVGVKVKCENRSLDDREGEAPLGEESCHHISDCTTNSLRVLFDTVIGPIAHLLKGDELIIVPDGPLCLARYAACVDQASKDLSESTRIRILPSLTSLKLITSCPEDYHSKNGVLLVGDPCLERVRPKYRRLNPLPGAREEVKMIGQILNTTPLTGEEATKDEVLKQLGSVTLVHIAAHGDTKAGEILLAPNQISGTSRAPKEKDYLLKMSDVQAVQLRARLVILSCSHSTQERITPEGVVGLGRAFLSAGARSVLVSIWSIADLAIMEFMKSFYEHLARGHSASVALNRAMKCLRESEEFCAVKCWAPFVLIGDDVTIEFGQNH